MTLRGVTTSGPPPDTWFEATGTWRAETRSAEDTRPPILDVTTLRTIPPPENRYLR